jgi:hypothetical protein
MVDSAGIRRAACVVCGDKAAREYNINRISLYP